MGLRQSLDERRDDDAALGLLALAEGLDPGAFGEVVDGRRLRSVAVIGSSSISLPVLSARSAARSAWRSIVSRRRSR